MFPYLPIFVLFLTPTVINDQGPQSQTYTTNPQTECIRATLKIWIRKQNFNSCGPALRMPHWSIWMHQWYALSIREPAQPSMPTTGSGCKIISYIKMHTQPSYNVSNHNTSNYVIWHNVSRLHQWTPQIGENAANVVHLDPISNTI